MVRSRYGGKAGAAWALAPALLAALIGVGPASADDGPFNLTLNVLSFGPHVGQKGELRIVNRTTGYELARYTLSSILPVSIPLPLGPILEKGNSYDFEFYADANDNKLYDPPPEDHAWRVSLVDVQKDTTITWTYNEDFVDIEWTYAVKLTMSGMSPHLGQTILARLVEDGTEAVAGKAMRLVTADAMLFPIPGVEIGGSYRVDFFVDVNGNGHYDAPPVDHAWRITLANAAGDTSIAFAHNTNFTDILFPTRVAYDLPRQVAEVELSQNRPNPFNPATSIPFALPRRSHVHLTIYNALGQEVRTLVDAPYDAGRYRARWDGADARGRAVSGGVYFARLTTDGAVRTRRLVLVR